MLGDLGNSETFYKLIKERGKHIKRSKRLAGRRIKSNNLGVKEGRTYASKGRALGGSPERKYLFPRIGGKEDGTKLLNSKYRGKMV